MLVDIDLFPRWPGNALGWLTQKFSAYSLKVKKGVSTYVDVLDQSPLICGGAESSFQLAAVPTSQSFPGANDIVVSGSFGQMMSVTI